jgi:hypothetical protein
MIGMQCAAVDQQQLAKYGFCGPLLSILGFIWWLGYSVAATSAANTGNHWDSTLTPYRTGAGSLPAPELALPMPAALVHHRQSCKLPTRVPLLFAAVVAVSWTATGVYIPVFLVCAVTVSAAARAAAKVNDTRSNSSRRFSQPASPPVSPIKSNKSFGSSYGEPVQACSLSGGPVWGQGMPEAYRRERCAALSYMTWCAACAPAALPCRPFQGARKPQAVDSTPEPTQQPVCSYVGWAPHATGGGGPACAAEPQPFHDAQPIRQPCPQPLGAQPCHAQPHQCWIIHNHPAAKRLGGPLQLPRPRMRWTSRAIRTAVEPSVTTELNPSKPDYQHQAWPSDACQCSNLA